MTDRGPELHERLVEVPWARGRDQSPVDLLKVLFPIGVIQSAKDPTCVSVQCGKRLIKSDAHYRPCGVGSDSRQSKEGAIVLW